MKNFTKIFLVIALAILLIFLSNRFIFSRFFNKTNLEKESIEFTENYKNCPFEISKIILYSTAYAQNKNTTFQKSCWILDIFQYTDIAIYINNGNDEITEENSVKKLILENISITQPVIGYSKLYYLDTLNFGTENLNENYAIDNSLEFTIINDENKENWVQYNTPVFFTDCSNPITLKYVNQPVLKNYEIQSTEPVFFDGRVLKMANIDLYKLQTKINFTINLKSNSNKSYSYNLSIPINLENENSSIYNGNILIENKYENLKFIMN